MPVSLFVQNKCSLKEVWIRFSLLGRPWKGRFLLLSLAPLTPVVPKVSFSGVRSMQSLFAGAWRDVLELLVNRDLFIFSSSWFPILSPDPEGRKSSYGVGESL